MEALGKSGLVSFEEDIAMQNHEAIEAFYANYLDGRDSMVTAFEVHRDGVIGAVTFIYRKGNYGNHDSISKELNFLKGVLVCADCGKNMSLWRDRSGVKLNPPRVYYKYSCQTYQTLKEKGCTRKRLNKKDVEMAVEEAIRLHIKLFLDGKKALEQLNRIEQARQINAGYQKEILEACKRKIKAENRAGSLYNDYADGILSESDYLYAKEKYLSEAAAEEQRIIELQEMQRRYEKGRKENSKLETIVEQYKNFDNLTENIIKSFISKVLVYSDERLEICRVKAKLPMAANM